MGMFDKMKDKAGELANEHDDQVEQQSDAALDRGEQLAGERLDGGHSDEVSRGRDVLDDRIGSGGGDEGQTPP